MGTDVEIHTADAGDLPYFPATLGKRVNARYSHGHWPVANRRPRGALHESFRELDRVTHTQFGNFAGGNRLRASRGVSNTNTDLFEANSIQCFLQHFRFAGRSGDPQQWNLFAA